MTAQLETPYGDLASVRIALDLLHQAVDVLEADPNGRADLEVSIPPGRELGVVGALTRIATGLMIALDETPEAMRRRLDARGLVAEGAAIERGM